MTYNVFSGTLNPTHFISLHCSDDVYLREGGDDVLRPWYTENCVVRRTQSISYTHAGRVHTFVKPERIPALRTGKPSLEVAPTALAFSTTGFTLTKSVHLTSNRAYTLFVNRSLSTEDSVCIGIHKSIDNIWCYLHKTETYDYDCGCALPLNHEYVEQWGPKKQLGRWPAETATVEI